MKMNRKLCTVLGMCAVLVVGATVTVAGFSKNEVKASEVKQDTDFTDTTFEEEKNIQLSDYTDEVVFKDKNDIEVIKEEYGIAETEEIEEIYYVPLEDDKINLSREVGAPEFKIKKKGSTEGKGRLLRSSWFENPGGTLSISESVETTVSFSSTAGIEGKIKKVKSTLSLAYGFDVSKSISCTDTQNVVVSKGCKRNCKAYVNIKTYNYELWEDDQWYDDYICKGKIKKPVGVIFTIGKNTKK